ncbi:MAG: hypothetical protein J7641_10305 [Cyanobacteria bacterium SID2]|nr:hypothetical protein [Cyanobacteria bacterium SID2]
MPSIVRLDVASFRSIAEGFNVREVQRSRFRAFAQLTPWLRSTFDRTI